MFQSPPTSYYSIIFPLKPLILSPHIFDNPSTSRPLRQMAKWPSLTLCSSSDDFFVVSYLEMSYLIYG